jgi:hypothetical protein
MYVNYHKLLVKCCNRWCVVLNHVWSWLVGWLVWNPSWFHGLPGLYVLKCGSLRRLFLYLCSYNLDGSVTWKEASHGLLTHHLVCWVLKWTNGVHTHTLLHPWGPTPKKEGPLNSEGHPTPLSHSTASPLDTFKKTHLGAILCVDLWWFKVSLI